MQGLVLVHRQQNLLPAAGRCLGTANHELPGEKGFYILDGLILILNY